MAYLSYKARKDALEGETSRELTNTERDEIARSVVGMKSGDLKRCLQSLLALRYWDALASVMDGKYYNTKYFSSKWTQKTVHSPGGGVS